MDYCALPCMSKNASNFLFGRPSTGEHANLPASFSGRTKHIALKRRSFSLNERNLVLFSLRSESASDKGEASLSTIVIGENQSKIAEHIHDLQPSPPENDSLQQLPTASLTHTFARGIGRMSSSVGVVGRIAPRISRIGVLAGPLGILMAVAVALAGFTSAVMTHIHQSKEIWGEENCRKCSGSGAVKCDLCDGEGEISWEGKLYRRHLCPACLGKKHRKCPSCGVADMPSGLFCSIKKPNQRNSNGSRPQRT